MPGDRARGSTRQSMGGAGRMVTGTGQLRREMAGGVMILTLDHPPNNRPSAAIRAALLREIADPQGAGAIVLRGEGRCFAAAAPVDVDDAAPTLAEVCRAIDLAPVPVVAALHGAVIGAGADLALAAHARVAAEDCRLSFPEIGLGLLPQGGATQRLPRLVGGEEALRLLLSGRALSATEALVIGLFDHVVEGDPLHAALAMAGRMTGPRPAFSRVDGLRDPLRYQRAIAQARAEGAAAPLSAVRAVVDCIEAAQIFPAEHGLRLEATLNADLAALPEVAGLRAAALAERRAASLPAPVAAARARGVTHLGLSGSGPGMVSVALLALSRGFKVTWAEPDRARLTGSIEALATRMEAEVAAGRMAPTVRDADWARLEAASDPAALRTTGFGLIAGAGAERALAAIRRVAPDLPVAVFGGAEGAMGLGLPPSSRMSELSLPDGVAPVMAATAVHVLRRLSLPPLLVGRMPILGPRVAAAGRGALLRMVGMGVAPAALQAALAGFGAAMPALPPADDGVPPPVRDMAAGEIVNRWLASMANEGLRLLAAGVARRPSDIDHLMVTGHGFPRWQGGPMHRAEERGLMVLRADLRRWQDDDPIWQPAALIDRLVADGRRLTDMNGRSH